jgi:aspartate 1-decarboxylase
MLITMLKSKIHRATITDANLNYMGSITIDADLMRLADLVPYEKVDIANVNNGHRFSTYVIEGKPGSGVIALNGAAARLGETGDLIIILSYCQMDKASAASHKPLAVHVDAHNRPTK